MTAPDQLSFHRPPRAYPAAVPDEPMHIAAPPVEQPPAHGSVLQVLMPLVGGVGLVGFAVVYKNTTFLYVAGAMMVLMLMFSVGMRLSQKRGVRKRAAAEARRYSKYLGERDRELAEAGDRQRAALERLYPEPKKLWTQVVKRREIWERRPDHPDFLHVRLGQGTVKLDRKVELDIGMNPLAEYQKHPLHEARRLVERRGELRNEAVVVDLSDVGVLAVTGDRQRSRAWARGLMTQLAAWRAPHDLRMVTAFEPEDSDEWEWGKWLPHQQADPGAPASGGLLLARSAPELEAMLELQVRPRIDQLRRIADADQHTQRSFSLTAPELIVIVDGWTPTHAANDGPSFKELVARARELRAVLVLLIDDRSLEPSSIDARLAIPERGLSAWEVAGQDAPSITDIWIDEVELGIAEAIARALTPLRLAEGSGDGERGLSASVRLVELLGVHDADDIRPEHTQTRRSRATALRAPIGRSADGEVLWLDLKQAAEGGMGPHGVLVGATGSGKSELLRSLVAGLAATHDPEHLAFVLVDYKGGAAFADLARLPHVAGMITNLQRDLSLVDRMRDALIGEQERRQTMLREAGNVDDIVAYQARRESDPSLPPMPDLLVIVDEFAELLAARPEYIDLFVGLGRVGRSLGIHLLMSSQRLDEGRLRGLESHLRYRLCLRTYSAPESKMVIGTADAYLLPSLPGLGYLKVDTTHYVQFRAALSSSPHDPAPADVAAAAPPPVRAFDAAELAPGDTSVEERVGPALTGRSELQVLVDRLGEGREPVHQVWVAPLAEAEPLDAVLESVPWWKAPTRAEGLEASIGRLDRPAEQRTEPFQLDLTGAGGHVAVVGAPRTGKSTLLRTLAASLMLRHTPDRLQMYAIDLGGGLLGALEPAPHVGGVAGKLDREAIERVVRQLRAELEDREALFRERRWESMREARQDAEGVPDIVLLVDGWEAFKREFEGLDRELEELAAAGLSFGVHLVVSANRWAEIRPALLDNLGTRLELRLNDAIDSLVSRAAADALPDGIAGRGLTMAGLYFQVALPRVDGRATDEGTGEALATIVEQAAAHWSGARAERIRLLPRTLDADELPSPSHEDGVAIGVDERALAPVWLDLLAGDPHFLVFGDAETGKSSLLRGIARGLTAVHSPDELQLTIVDVRRSLVDLAEGAHVRAYAANAMAAQDAAQSLLGELEPRLSAAGASPLAGPSWQGPRHVVLFDDYDLSAGPTGGPLAPLLDLLAVGRDIGLHVVLTRRVGGSARGAYEAVFGRLRELGSPGLLMSGDPGEGPLLSGIKAAPQPAGRGLLVRRGERPLLVQTAFTPPGQPAGAAAMTSDRPREAYDR
jgi:S-DNA-T family DNA segregation ATPase FtsK/SpoIIIE